MVYDALKQWLKDYIIILLEAAMLLGLGNKTRNQLRKGYCNYHDMVTKKKPQGVIGRNYQFEQQTPHGIYMSHKKGSTPFLTIAVQPSS
jgi:hypothetical protein